MRSPSFPAKTAEITSTTCGRCASIGQSTLRERVNSSVSVTATVADELVQVTTACYHHVHGVAKVQTEPGLVGTDTKWTCWGVRRATDVWSHVPCAIAHRFLWMNICDSDTLAFSKAQHRSRSAMGALYSKHTAEVHEQAEMTLRAAGCVAIGCVKCFLGQICKYLDRCCSGYGEIVCVVFQN